MRESRRDRKLAFAWHLAEFLGLLSLIGLLWSIRHLTDTESDARDRSR